MKRVFAICSLVVCIVGVSLYLNRSDSATPKKEQVALEKKNDTLESPTTPTKNDATISKEKGCGCCRSTLAKIKAKRKALEMWAREMIATHGYDEGMKRVTAKSPTLAKRIQRLLEKKKNRPMSSLAEE